MSKEKNVDYGSLVNASAIAGLGKTEINEQQIETFNQTIVAENGTPLGKDIIEAVAHAVPVKEYDDNEREKAPINLSLSLAQQLSQVEVGILKSWAPLTYISSKTSSIEIKVPYKVISSVRDGRYVDTIKFTELQKRSLEDNEPKIEVAKTTETEKYLNIDTAFTTPTGESALLKPGVLIPLRDLDPRIDYTNSVGAPTEVLRTGNFVESFVLELDDGGTQENVLIDVKTILSENNAFKPVSEGDGSKESLNAKFTLVLTPDTTMVTTPEGYNDSDLNTVVSTIAQDKIPPLSSYVVTVGITGDSDLRLPNLMISGTFVRVEKMVQGGVEIPADEITDVTMKVVAVNMNNSLTNTNKRFLGHFTRTKTSKYELRTIPKTPILEALPTNKTDKTKYQSTQGVINSIGYSIDTEMSKTFVKALPVYLKNLKLCKEALITPKVLSSNIIKLAVAEDVHTRGSITTQDTMGVTDNRISGIRQSIDKMAKKLIRDSGFVESMRVANATGLTVEVLVNIDEDLASYTNPTGYKVKVTETDLIKDEIWITITAKGPQIKAGINQFGFATIVTKANVVDIDDREINDTSVKYVEVKPEFETNFITPVLGLIKLS